MTHSGVKGSVSAHAQARDGTVHAVGYGAIVAVNVLYQFAAHKGLKAHVFMLRAIKKSCVGYQQCRPSWALSPPTNCYCQRHRAADTPRGMPFCCWWDKLQ